jgi:HEAT repeat protein
VAAAKLLGGIGDVKARKPLFAMLNPREPHVVRTHALGALVQCLRGKPLTAAEVETLLGWLDDDDEAGVLRPAVRLLEDQPLERAALARLNQLAESPQPIVKRFAIQKLGGFESGAVVKTLISYLTDDSYARRDQATATLKTLPAARSALMKELLACDDERKAWTLADIVLLHDRSWKRDTLTALWDKLQKALETRGGPASTPPSSTSCRRSTVHGCTSKSARGPTSCARASAFRRAPLAGAAQRHRRVG